MSELSSSGVNPALRPPIKPSRRRDKIQVSCMTCRQKKLKCDRLKPCGNCIKRGQPASCDYLKPDAARDRPGRPHATTNVQDRVRHLEDLVMNLMRTRGDSGLEPSAEGNPPATSPRNPIQRDGFEPANSSSPDMQMEHDLLEESLGKFTKGKDQMSFVGSGHWEAILDDIAELKDHFDNSNDGSDIQLPSESKADELEPRILFGGDNHASRSEIMSSIPARLICDRLISRYFNSMDMAPMIVHAPTFLKEYDQMWNNPDSVSLIWIGLLFSFLGLASHFHIMSGDEINDIPEPCTSLSEMVTHYRDRTAQCLVSTNYLKPVRYTVETLLCYYALELFLARDAEFGAWVVLGIIIRVSMRLGYHRDASHYPTISPFDGEMQRRVWCMVVQLDLVTSTQVGLPRMVRESETDTAEPKNLLDTDFDESMDELPAPRSSADATPVAYAIFKIRLLRVLGLVVDEANSITSPPYQDTMRLDAKVFVTYQGLPPYLIIRPLHTSVTDHPDLILRRLLLEILFQKARCVLHRKYLIPAETDPQYKYSRSSCIDAAMKLLIVQSDFHEASQPGGQLFRDRWRLSAMINQDYLLAAMILCLDLDWRMKHGKNTADDEEDDIQVLWPREVRLQSLNRSYEIWCASSMASALAAKAAEALRVILTQLKSKTLETEPVVSTSSSNWSRTLSVGAESTDFLNLAPDLPPSLLPAQQTYFEDFSSPGSGMQYNSLTEDLMPGMTDTDMNFDWGLWDSHFQTAPTSSMPPGLEDIGSFTFQV